MQSARWVRAVVEIFAKRYDKIMNGEYHDELLYDEDCRAGSFVTACKELLRDRVFSNDEVLRLEVRGRQVIHDLMKLFWEGAQSYLQDRKTHAKTYGGKLYLLISENYRELFEQRLSADEDKTYCAVGHRLHFWNDRWVCLQIAPGSDGWLKSQRASSKRR